jgi:hypothetical protein
VRYSVTAIPNPAAKFNFFLTEQSSHTPLRVDRYDRGQFVQGFGSKESSVLLLSLLFTILLSGNLMSFFKNYPILIKNETMHI